MLLIPIPVFFLFFHIGITSGQRSQQDIISDFIPSSSNLNSNINTNPNSNRYKYICGSDPFRFFSEFPCNLYPLCINGGFNINVGCQQDYQCTPYSSDAVCVNNCCCTVPRVIVSETTTRIFFDNSSSLKNPYIITFLIFLFTKILVF